jgi:hypothetical protein
VCDGAEGRTGESGSKQGKRGKAAKAKGHGVGSSVMMAEAGGLPC